MEGYRCPNKKCNAELHFEMIKTAGMRVYREVGIKKVYNAYCPTCDEYMKVDDYNRKLVNEEETSDEAAKK